MVAFSSDRIFLVTGASSGIGEGVALRLNELGATVIGIGRDAARLEALRSKARFPERLFIERKDLTDDIEGLPEYVRTLRNQYGPLAGMAYCAGIADLKPLQLWGYEQAKAIFDINYFAAMGMLKGFGNRRNNAGKGSAAVFIASAAARLADKGHISYAGSKSALITSCEVAAKELSVSGVRVSTISPKVVDTPMSRAMAEKSGVKIPAPSEQLSDVVEQVMALFSEKIKDKSEKMWSEDSEK